ncbi:MAG: ABC transporter permease [Armatimonadota bacterium]
MEQIGVQVKLPFSTAFQISLQGIRIRLGRALVTISGVVLGIAFLMSVLTGQLISQATAEQQQRRQTEKLMQNMVKSELGSIQGKNIGVIVVGTLSPEENSLLQKIVADKPALVNAFGVQMAGMQTVDVKAVGNEADLVLVLGDGKIVDASLAELSANMAQKVIIDAQAPGVRTYADGGNVPAKVTLISFAGNQANAASLAAAAQQQRVRTIWIVTISLLVTVIGITNALLMSVTERFKEIGTMKCLGALSSFIRMLFLIESALIGFVGSLVGMIIGVLFPMLVHSFTDADTISEGFNLVFTSMNYQYLLIASLASVVVGTLLSIFAAIYPATFASKMVPASALRSNV